jgi:hypothetical protein
MKPKTLVSGQVAKVVHLVQQSSSPLAGSFDWSHLPTEIRLQILEHYLTFPRAIIQKNHDYFLRMRVLRLLHTKDKGFVSQVKAFYYGKNTFRLTPEDLVMQLNPSLQIGQHIRHQEIEMLSLPQGRLAMKLGSD